MNSAMLDALCQFGGMVVTGLVFTLYGFRVIGTKPGVNPASDAFHLMWGRYFRISGGILMAVGAVMLCARIASI
ncbi:MAG: hypothetical protein JWO38_6535 [Gemmataceae bacterium]|nr:hypothetical protein [Gemmataceae bacterium]